MKPIFAIDPGNIESAYCIYYPDTNSLGDFGKLENKRFRELVIHHTQWEYQFCCETLKSFGQKVWQQCLETQLYAGKIFECVERKGQSIECIYRQEVKMHLLGKTKGNDAQVNAAIRSKFNPTGGGKDPWKGIKSNPGPLYGVSNDVWAAIGVALTFHAKHEALNAN